MLFVERAFAIFFLVVLPVSWMLRAHATAWKTFMLSSSLFFYAWWRRDGFDDWSLAGITWLPRYVCYLLVFALVNWLIGQWAARGAARIAVWSAVVFNLGVLAYFKYFEWGQSIANDLFLDSKPVQIILPVGVSFLTFQALGYVIDIGRGKQEPIDVLDFFTYLFFFPHVVAGPLVRVSELVPQLRERANPRRVDVTHAFALIALGFVKKVVLSAWLNDWIVKDVFGNPKAYGAVDNIVAMYAYAAQIYCDFSGYTDIAIGLALLVGIQFPQNFANPYRALSIQDFWRRWHMSLSRWLRDYLYIGLGGNRRGEMRTYINLFLTMLIGGLWHGADMTFVIWGALHGLALVVERFVTGGRESSPSGGRAVMRWLITFHVVCIGWVFFNSGSPTNGKLDSALDMLSQMVSGWGDSVDKTSFGVVLVIAIVLAYQFIPDGIGGEILGRISAIPAAVQGLLLGVVIAATYRWGNITDFIYFQF